MKCYLAPGARAELDAEGRGDAFAGLAELNPGQEDSEAAIIIGMRAGSPGRMVPGTLAGFACIDCGHDVQLAPSGRRCAADGAHVTCLECFVVRTRT